MDFVLIGAAVLFALIGLIRGGAKMFFGLFMLLIIMVGAAFASSAICPLFLKKETETSVEYTSAANLLMDPIAGLLPSDGEFGEMLDTAVTKGEDGTLYLGETPLTEAVGSKVPYVGSFISSFVTSAAREGETLRTTFSYKIAEYAYETVLWVILVIALAIVRNIFRKKIYRFLDKHSGPSKIDRLIGLVLNLAILLVIVWGAGAIIAHFDDGSNWANTANVFLTDGMLAGPLMSNNPLLKLMGLTIPVAGGVSK